MRIERTPVRTGRGNVRLFLAACGLLLLRPVLHAQAPEEYHHRADLALQSFLIKFWSQSQEYLRHEYPGSSPTGYWTFAQGFDALLDGAERTGGSQYSGLVNTFYEAQNRRGWIVSHYDDESWMALALVRAYDVLGEERFLSRAITLYEDVRLGWDATCCGSPAGGIWWDKAHTQKATASNAGPVILAARLFERTGEESYLGFARQVYAFWFANMVSHSSGQVTDHVNSDGTRVFWRFTYNEGLMVGASVELYRATGEAGFLINARRIANFMALNEVTPSAFGNVLTDGSNSGCGGDCHAFKGPAFRYLMELYQEVGVTAYGDILKASADAIWNLARNPSEDLFSVSWTGPPMNSFSEPQTAAAVMALNLYAMEAGPYPGSGTARGQYEAEDATSRRLRLEAEHGSFTGWGYVAGWNQDGQRVEFEIEAPVDGSHELALRFAAGAGDASRVVLVDGVAAAANLSFPSTGAWSSYDTVTVRRNLTAGQHTVTVEFDARRGSGNFLNLDHLRVASPVLFRRGDCNDDGAVDLSDAVRNLRFCFGGSRVSCVAACDVDGDGVACSGVTDGVRLLMYLFRDGDVPPAPFPECGTVGGEVDCVMAPGSCQ